MLSEQNPSTHERDNLESVRLFFENFLESFEEIEYDNDSDIQRLKKPYHSQAIELTKNKSTTMYINFKHLTERGNLDFIEAIYKDFFLYENSLKKAIYNFMYRHFPEYARNKIFYVSFYNLHEVEDIRHLKTEKLGRLLQVRGTVTRVSDVQPELLIGNFQCKDCEKMIGFKEQQFRYTLPKMCTVKNCQNKTNFKLISEGSVYVDWQQIRIQENNSDLPSGTVPRTFEVVLRNDQVDRSQPGDRVLITGTLIVVPEESNNRQIGENYEMEKKIDSSMNNKQSYQFQSIQKSGTSDLNYKLVFLGNNIQIIQSRFQKHNNIENFEAYFQKEDDKDYQDYLTKQDMEEIYRIQQTPNLFDRLAKLIAPSVLENLEIKKGILLMLFSGVNKKTKDGLKLRGDINICLVGDPSTAKSQFLKFVNNFIPRCVYTSGRGTTSAGLTVALIKDPSSGDFLIEPGALILANNGICCIDEFDKIQEKDSVAIHEAMEQQTISISKGGINATYNTKCSILAAMNPIMGKYDKSKVLKKNINLSTPLMSRFDIFFVLTDECKESVDMAIARRIVGMHKNEGQKRNFEIEEDQTDSLLTHASLLRYIQFASRVRPKITPEAKKMLIQVYLRMRTNEFSIQKSAYRITVRQLESLIRLSEACAKVYCSMDVTEEHVHEAVKLLSSSIIKIDSKDFIIDIDEAILQQKDEEQITEPKKEENQTEKILKQKPEKEHLKLNKKIYQNLSDELKLILRKNIKDTDREQIPIEELALSLVQQHIAEFNNMEEFSKYEKMTKGIIKRMAKNNEGFQIIDDNEGQSFVRFHIGTGNQFQIKILIRQYINDFLDFNSEQIFFYQRYSLFNIYWWIIVFINISKKNIFKRLEQNHWRIKSIFFDHCNYQCYYIVFLLFYLSFFIFALFLKFVFLILFTKLWTSYFSENFGKKKQN